MMVGLLTLGGEREKKERAFISLDAMECALR